MVMAVSRAEAGRAPSSAPRPATQRIGGSLRRPRRAACVVVHPAKIALGKLAQALTYGASCW